MYFDSSFENHSYERRESKWRNRHTIRFLKSGDVQYGLLTDSVTPLLTYSILMEGYKDTILDNVTVV